MSCALHRREKACKNEWAHGCKVRECVPEFKCKLRMWVNCKYRQKDVILFDMEQDGTTLVKVGIKLRL